jgi:hypothetical protein
LIFFFSVELDFGWKFDRFAVFHNGYLFFKNTIYKFYCEIQVDLSNFHSKLATLCCFYSKLYFIVVVVVFFLFGECLENYVTCKHKFEHNFNLIESAILPAQQY